MPTYFPISNTVPQYTNNGVPYSGAVLKAYADTTSTPISMATDYTGNTLVSTITLNAAGYPSVSGNVVVPHIAENYKLALYPNSAAAASNTGEIWMVDNFQISSAVSSGALTDIASAATVNLNSTSTNYFNITGTTTITGVTLAEGVEVRVKFAGILTLTHGAFLILLGGVNITTASGDIAVLRGEAGGVVRMVDYQRSAILGGGGLVLIATQTVSSAVASVNFVNGSGGVVFDATYKTYLVVLTDVTPVSGSPDFLMRTTRDGGATWRQTANDYGYACHYNTAASGAMAVFNQNATATSIFLGNAVDTGGIGLQGYVYFYTPATTTLYHTGNSRLQHGGSASAVVDIQTGFVIKSGTAINGFQFFFNSVNIAGGTFKLYGIA